MMKAYYDTIPTPVGEFSVAIDEAGAVVATAFGSETALRSRLKATDIELLHAPKRIAAARAQVIEYFSGKREGFDLLLAAAGTPFQKRVWTALREIPFGETRSYGALAKTLRSAARAVGRANATNPICLIVPCHRVIGADGSLTGFAFGEGVKLSLLRHEGALAAT
jgi:methylated-DNA-[protein]-cysteine S-methyltransferase